MTVELNEKPVTAALGQASVMHAPPQTPCGMRGLWSLRQLIALMVRRDFLGRYRGSLLGAFWPFINPIGHLLLYTFVFCIVLKVRFGQDASTSNFALYLMTGLLPWNAFAETLARSTTCVLEVPNLVKRVVFPLEILPLVLVVSSLLTETVGLAVLLIFGTIYLKTVHATLAFLPLVVLAQVMFTGGLGWLLASLGVYIRDIRHMMSLALSVWMYTTPIVYPATALPEELKFMLWVNPMAGIVGDYRRVILEGQPPDWPMFALYFSFAALTWFAGYYFFYKTKRSFADVM